MSFADDDVPTPSTLAKYKCNLQLENDEKTIPLRDCKMLRLLYEKRVLYPKTGGWQIVLRRDDVGKISFSDLLSTIELASKWHSTRLEIAQSHLEKTPNSQLFNIMFLISHFDAPPPMQKFVMDHFKRRMTHPYNVKEMILS